MNKEQQETFNKILEVLDAGGIYLKPGDALTTALINELNSSSEKSKALTRFIYLERENLKLKQVLREIYSLACKLNNTDKILHDIRLTVYDAMQ